MSSERGNSHTSLEIGRSLERARAERGLSLWQVEEATKIRARYLHDLERENFDVLPAVYVLGSLKTYADFLGLDGEALARELKSRQGPPPEERDPTPEEPTLSERGGFLAALGGLPLIGERDAVGDDQDAAPAAGFGYGSGLYLGLGAASILVLAIALTTILFWGGDRPAVSQVREPAIPEAPSRIAFSGNAEDSKDDERNQEAGSKDAGSKDDRPGEQAESFDGGDEKGKKEDEKDQAEKSDQDDTRPEDTGDVAVAPPAVSTASASTASASASASASATASATSTPVATAPASAPPAATAPAAAAPSTAPAAPGAADPATAPTPPRPEPAPTVVRRTPAATGAAGDPGSGPTQSGGLDRAQLADEIFDRVRSATDFAR